MFRPALITIALLAFTTCTSYENEPAYEIQVGESVDLYVWSNSCCYICWLDQERVTHVDLSSERVVEESDLVGGSNVLSWTFKGRSPGTDTIRIAQGAMGLFHAPCEEFHKDVPTQVSTYVIHVVPR